MWSEDDDYDDYEPPETEEQARARITGAGEFRGRSDGKVQGRGMLGLISAIPPAPRVPTVPGVRMLAPTIPSERPGRRISLGPAPVGLPDDAIVRFTGATTEPGPLDLIERVGGLDAVQRAAAEALSAAAESTWPEVSWEPDKPINDTETEPAPPPTHLSEPGFDLERPPRDVHRTGRDTMWVQPPVAKRAPRSVGPKVAAAAAVLVAIAAAAALL